MNILKIGKLIDPTEFDQYIIESEKLEIVYHKYGTEYSIPDYPCWMEYRNEGGIDGTIGFTRNTSKNPILKEMILKLIDILTPIFHERYPPVPERVHFMKTTGNIPVHKDEGNRACCINIGLKNTSSAITRISNDNVYVNFSANNTPYILEDGVGYLLNTHQFHSVDGDLHTPRYLITYGFTAGFNLLEKSIRIP